MNFFKKRNVRFYCFDDKLNANGINTQIKMQR